MGTAAMIIPAAAAELPERQYFHSLISVWAPPLTAWDEVGWTACVSSVQFNLALHVTETGT